MLCGPDKVLWLRIVHAHAQARLALLQQQAAVA
jgi:hypothetical protein